MANADADGCCDDVDGDSSSNVVDVGFVPEMVAGPGEVMLIPEAMRSVLTGRSGSFPESALQIYGLVDWFNRQGLHRIPVVAS